MVNEFITTNYAAAGLKPNLLCDVGGGRILEGVGNVS